MIRDIGIVLKGMATLVIWGAWMILDAYHSGLAELAALGMPVAVQKSFAYIDAVRGELKS